MKVFMQHFILAVLLVFAVPSVYADLRGFSSTGVAICEDGTYPINASGPTFPDCEAQRTSTVSLYEGMGCDINSDPCTPVFITIPELEEQKLPLTIGPVCTSCPYLIDSNHVQLIFPESFDMVLKLAQRHNVFEYNRRLAQLQREFDIENFERAMYKLEQSMNKLKQAKPEAGK